MVGGTDVKYWECHRCLGPIEVEAIYCPECEARLQRMRGLSQLIKVVVIISLVIVGIIVAIYVRYISEPIHGLSFDPYAICILTILLIILILLVVPILMYLRKRQNV
ncbi:MAG: hypothetical protein GQ558_10080 [Thermoplasmata archaeon]|nr:hypothetical protein [Thermoplasmata archaeon]